MGGMDSIKFGVGTFTNEYSIMGGVWEELSKVEIIYDNWKISI